MEFEPTKKEEIDSIKDLVKKLDDSFSFFTIPLSRQIKENKTDEEGDLPISFFDIEEPVNIDEKHREEFEDMDYKDMQNLTLLSEVEFLSNISYMVRSFYFDPETNERVEKDGD